MFDNFYMQTILERCEAILVRDKSQFIGILLHVTSVNDVNNYLKQIRSLYPKAKHYCYAYIIDNESRCSDDGEPSKTAGFPLLELLQKKEMNETLLVVVRYFGGVLLGASRLLSTYIETGVKTFEKADLVKIETKYIYHAEFNYHDFDILKRLIKNTSMLLENINYSDTIIVDILGDENSSQLLADWFPKNSIDVQGKKRIYRRL